MTRSTLLVTSLACAVFCAAAAQVARHASATVDEVPHIAAGVAYLTGDLRLNREHPPLVKVLAAAALPSRDPPLALPGAAADPYSAQWTWGSEWLHDARRSPWTCCGGLACRWSAEFNAGVLRGALDPAPGGPSRGLRRGLSARDCPTWIAHSALVTTDAAATLFFFAASSSVLPPGAFGARPALAPRDGARGSLALALATKYSMLAALGLVPLGVALDALWLRRRGALLWTAAASGLAGLVAILFAWGLPPQPALYLEGVDRVGKFHVKGFMFYAFGTFFHDQDPLYFARALLVKLSLPVVLLCGLSPLLVRRDPLAPTRERSEPRFSWLLAVPPLGYYLLMATQAPAIGVRYVLPVVPFLCVLAGAAATGCWRRPRLRWLLAPLAAVQVLGLSSALRASPLAFFNGLGCNTGDALPCLDDSNVDWGQALPDLKRYRDEHFPNQTIRIFYFGSSPPGAYVDHIERAQSSELAQPMRAVYAMSLHERVRVRKRPGRDSWSPVQRGRCLRDLRHASAVARRSAGTAPRRVGSSAHGFAPCRSGPARRLARMSDLRGGPRGVGSPPDFNDDVSHAALARACARPGRSGADPTDPWLVPTTTGFPLAHHYQHLLHVAVGGLSALTGIRRRRDPALDGRARADAPAHLVGVVAAAGRRVNHRRVLGGRPRAARRNPQPVWDRLGSYLWGGTASARRPSASRCCPWWWRRPFGRCAASRIRRGPAR